MSQRIWPLMSQAGPHWTPFIPRSSFLNEQVAVSFLISFYPPHNAYGMQYLAHWAISPSSLPLLCMLRQGILLNPDITDLQSACSRNSLSLLHQLWDSWKAVTAAQPCIVGTGDLNSGLHKCWHSRCFIGRVNCIFSSLFEVNSLS